MVMLDAITEYFASLSAGWFYVALFLSAYIENVVPPVPGDTVTVFAAYIVGRTQERFLGVFLSTTLGSVAGFMTLYLLGRLIHPEYFVRKDFRFFPASQFQKAGQWYSRWGYWVILFNRFLSGVRSVISVVAGIYRLSWSRVLLLTTLSCLVWNGLLIWAGYALGSNWRVIEEVFRQYNRILLIAAALLIVVWLIRRRVAPSRARDS
jgi:membrane protein DedA with SNARE-associated domain